MIEEAITERSVIRIPICLSNLSEYDELSFCHSMDCERYAECKMDRTIYADELPANLSGDKRLLGLQRSNEGNLYLSYYSGAVWLRKPNAEQNGIPLVVAPKIQNLDTVSMWVEVAESSIYSPSLNENVFDCKPEEPTINGVTLPDVTLLQVAVFLKELAHFCQRDLRQDFTRIRDNLTGRIKGRILIGENIRQNTVRGRADRVACEYSSMTIDTSANRILKAALSRCYRYLSQNKSIANLAIWSRQCDAALSDVSTVQINDHDFSGIKYTGLMQRYRRPHALAKMILKRLRTDAQGNISDQEAVTVPFYVNMWRLFELYVGVTLEKTNICFKPQHSNTFNFELPSKSSMIIRPDYYGEYLNEGIVVDAKYKCITKEILKPEERNLELDGFAVDVSPSNSDIYQLIAYSAMLYAKTGKPVKKALLIAPGVPGNGNSISKFEDLIRIGRILNLKQNFENNDAEIIPEQIIVVPCPVPKRRESIKQ
jgi:5-methylcytosine-specific restriction endonuclease McrBC regulatory subunit McrC